MEHETELTEDHPPGTHDHRFRALALAANAAEPTTPSTPIARTT